MIKRVIAYGLLLVTILGLDRLSKLYALAHWCEPYEVNSYLFFQVSLNRGISWGLLNFAQSWIFFAVSAAIALITIGLIAYAFMRHRQGKLIIGELCVIAGSVSNIIDRILCHGVIDFIAVHKDQWTWPVFNVADACIVVGIGLMFLQLIGEHD